MIAKISYCAEKKSTYKLSRETKKTLLYQSIQLKNLQKIFVPYSLLCYHCKTTHSVLGMVMGVRIPSQHSVYTPIYKFSLCLWKIIPWKIVIKIDFDKFLIWALVVIRSPPLFTNHKKSQYNFWVFICFYFCIDQYWKKVIYWFLCKYFLIVNQNFF